MIDVLTIGSGTVDHFLTVEQPLSTAKVGDKILVKSMEMHSGGGATNVAAGLARLGIRVNVLVKLGSDHDAEFVLKELRKYNVRYLPLPPSRNSTDSSTIIYSTIEKDRIIFVHKGASQDLRVADIHHSSFQARWVYLGSLMGTAFAAAKEVARHSRRKNIPLLFNPSLYLAKKGVAYLKPILSATTLLIFNKEEAQALLNSTADTTTLLKRLRGLGLPMMVITDGPRRLYALNGNTIYAYLPPKVKIVDTTGAGDAFTSGLLAGILKGYSFKDALRLGQVNSLAVIQKVGTKGNLLGEQEARKWMGKLRIKVHLGKIP